mmetsp:Transcript_50031/g.161902  ORF Transcript_50031/g.161902 Transcript_50031/m.161902 type:complete len:809 (-) Transcript_50031:167-2593(-)
MTMLRTGILQDCGIEITFPAEWAANPTSSSATSTSNSAASAPSAPSVPAPESTPGVGGKYKDGWGGGDIIDLVVAADGAATATWPGAKYKEKGTLKGSILEGMMSLTAEFSDGVLRWSNGSTWTRLASAEASAPAAAAPAGASEAAASRQDGWGAAAQPQSAEEAWGGAAGAPAAGAWAGGSNLSATAASFEPAGFWAQPDDGADGGWKDKSGEDADPQKAARWRDFKRAQEENLAQGILPGKTAQDSDWDEQRLFSATHDTGIDFSLYDGVSVEITGPRSDTMPRFDSFEEIFEAFKGCVPEELINNIRRCGYTIPTPVQKYAIVAGLAGRDVMCCAQTGSGKTAAYMIPTLASMMKHNKATGTATEPYQGTCKPDTLVLSPTRELCLQIYAEAEKFFHRTPHRVVRVYGQEQAKTQIAELAKGCDLCVATPGRLWDFVHSGILEVTGVQCLIFDEADRMLQMEGGEGFLRQIVEDFGMPSKEDRQTMMFSATFPEECQKLASDYLYEHVFLGVGVVGGAAATVTQNFIQVSPDEKFDRLEEFIDEFLAKRETGERLLVFTNSKLQAKGLDEQLYRKNVDTGALHGDLLQTEREKNLDRFRKGQIDVMIATDVASRGLDITGVSQVLNYDLPFSIDVYVQRIGRTGRIGHRGCATTFLAVDKDGKWHDSTTDQVETLKKLPTVITGSGNHQTVPEWLERKVEELMNGSWCGAGAGASAASAAPRENVWESWEQVKSAKGAWDAEVKAPEVAPAPAAAAADTWRVGSTPQDAAPAASGWQGAAPAANAWQDTTPASNGWKEKGGAGWQ